MLGDKLFQRPKRTLMHRHELFMTTKKHGIVSAEYYQSIIHCSGCNLELDSYNIINIIETILNLVRENDEENCV